MTHGLVVMPLLGPRWQNLINLLNLPGDMIEANRHRGGSKTTRTFVSRQVHDPVFWLAIVAVLFGISQLFLMDMTRYLAWDEAVYYAELNPRVESIGMYAHRARGITLIPAPVTLFSDSILMFRTYLVAVSSIGLFAAYNTWSKETSWVAPLSAAMFGSSWLALAHGSELIPNYYSALLSVAAIGLTIAYHETRKNFMLLTISVVVCFATLVRPLDGVVLVLAIGLSSVLVRDSKNIRLIAGSTIGAVVGGLPWVVEAWFRFGGPLERLELTRQVVGGGLTNNVRTYLEMLAGPIVGGELAGTFRQSTLWILVLFSLSIAGLVLAKETIRPASLLALVTSGLLAAPYLFSSEAAAPRFMIPALALLSVSAATGVWHLSKLRQDFGWAIALTLALISVVTFNSVVITQWSAFQTRVRITAPVLGDLLAEQSTDRRCYFLSSYGYPQISVASGCTGGRLTSDASRNLEVLSEATARGLNAFALVASETPLKRLDTNLECTKVAALPETQWHLCSEGA